MARPLVVLGASGNCLDVLDVVDAINARASTWEVVGLLDDFRPMGSLFSGLPILGKLHEAQAMAGTWFINAIGSDCSFRQRPQVVAATGMPPNRFATLIHPLASVSARARLGRGVCVNPGVCVAGNVSVGDHVTLGPGVIVGHDSVIEDLAVLAPGATVSGYCHVGAACYVGAGAVIRQRVSVGTRALVGMGAVVLRDVAADVTVIGSPARLLERLVRQTN